MVVLVGWLFFLFSPPAQDRTRKLALQDFSALELSSWLVLLPPDLHWEKASQQPAPTRLNLFVFGSWVSILIFLSSVL